MFRFDEPLAKLANEVALQGEILNNAMLNYPTSFPFAHPTLRIKDPMAALMILGIKCGSSEVVARVIECTDAEGITKDTLLGNKPAYHPIIMPWVDLLELLAKVLYRLSFSIVNHAVLNGPKESSPVFGVKNRLFPGRPFQH